MLGNRNSQHSFAMQPSVKMARSQFDRSFTAKDTFNFDDLVPCFVDEVLPGDTLNLTLNTFGRLATPKVPIMDNMYIDFFFFFVPNRLVWDNFEKFMGAQTDPGDSISYLLPLLQATTGTGELNNSLADHFGIPTSVPDLPFQAGPFRAYNLIYNDWFRDQNMQDSLVVPMDDGPDAPTDYVMMKRGKRHDYFTSCLPWPQKGAAVTIPLGTSAPVYRTANALAWRVFDAGTNSLAATGALQGPTLNNSSANVSLEPGVGALAADLTTATAATINQLRQAFAIQSLLELDARSGTRYVELVAAHFNVTVPDYRVQRPEFLGGGHTKINSHPVAQTSPTSGSNPQGQLAAFATTQSSGEIGFTKSIVEHGYVIGLMSARADITYQQGLRRMWSRRTKYDMYWPKFQEIGEQAVLNKEIYATGLSGDDDVFGYQERFAEYRYMPSEIRGEFRSNYATSLDFWHMAQEFGATPDLDDAFIQSNTPIDRSIAVPGQSDLIIDMWFKYIHSRPMMTYSIPSNLGKF